MTAAPSTPRLKTRKPTGQVPWPLILLEGDEKAGKSLVPVVLSRSERVGMTYWFDLGEGAADEYAALPGAQYEVVEHDGTYRDILEQLTAVYHEAQRAAEAGEPPVVVVIDSMSLEWTMLVNWTNERARRSRNGQRKLADDPDAEIDPTSNLWNDANKRHGRVMDLLMRFPGIAIVTARGKEVAKMGANGQPLEGQKEWKVEGQKNLAYDASAWIRMHRDPRFSELVGVRSLRVSVPKGQTMEVPMTKIGDWDVLDLETFIFDVLGCSIETQPRNLKPLAGDVMQAVADEVSAITTEEDLKAYYTSKKSELRPEDVETLNSFVNLRLTALREQAGNPDQGPGKGDQGPVGQQPDQPEEPHLPPPDDDAAKLAAAAEQQQAEESEKVPA